MRPKRLFLLLPSLMASSLLSAWPQGHTPGSMAPDWSELRREVPALSSEIDLSLIKQFLIPGETTREWVSVIPDDDKLKIRTEGNQWETWHLSSDQAPPRYWRTANELQLGQDPEYPLQGLHVALDPGHLGGAWAVQESRSFQIEGAPFAIREGDLNRIVGRRLQPRLEALGARVSWVNAGSDSLAPLPMEAYREQAEIIARHILLDRWESLSPAQQEAAIARRQEIFYLVHADIRERARRVNEEIQPDLVLCLHFDARPWPPGDKLTLVETSEAHLIINGAYLASELALTDVRADFLRRVAHGVLSEELAWAKPMGQAMAKLTQAPPFTYSGENAIAVPGEPYLWARNLLANRLFLAPTLFLEPYVMNSAPDHHRLQEALGREERGEPPSPDARDVFDEYADFVIAGLRQRAMEVSEEVNQSGSLHQTGVRQATSEDHWLEE